MALSGGVEQSRASIEKKITFQLNAARDGLATQTRGIVQQAKGRIQEVDDSSKSWQNPLHDELLEFTRKNGSIVTTTLGKRMSTYRDLVRREEKRLHGLHEQYAQVSKRIEDFTTKHLGTMPLESLLKKPTAETPEWEDLDRQNLKAALEAEKRRVEDTASSVGEKAMEAMKANEKAAPQQPLSTKGPSPVLTIYPIEAGISYTDVDVVTATPMDHNSHTAVGREELDASKLIFTRNLKPKNLPSIDEVASMSAYVKPLVLLKTTCTIDREEITSHFGPYGPLTLIPTASVLHYATECFGGMKCYRGYDRLLRLFPDRNCQRMLKIAQRISLPSFNPRELQKLIQALVNVDGET
ncbi:MAG: hypothetical protein Q9170_001055 [Blastenia crenularia]